MNHHSRSNPANITPAGAEGRSRRRIGGLVAGVAVGLVATLGAAAPAFAHVAPSTGSSECSTDNQTWTATFSIKNDFPADMTIDSLVSTPEATVSGLEQGSVVLDGEYGVVTVSGIPLEADSITISYSVHWPNEDKAANEGTAARPESGCVVTTTTTPTTEAPTTTAPAPTTAAPTTTVAVQGTTLTPGEKLPVTGSSTAGTIAAGAAFVLVGWMLLRLNRRPARAN